LLRFGTRRFFIDTGCGGIGAEGEGEGTVSITEGGGLLVSRGVGDIVDVTDTGDVCG